MNQGSRTIPKQGIAATTGPTAGIPRNHPHRALHPARPAGRNQCSTALRTLHHHERLGQGHQPTIPRREVPWAHTAAGPTRTDQQPLPADLLLQRSVVGWIDTVQGCPQHPMGAPFLAKQPRWAAASIPSARPLRTGQPASARPRPSSSAMARPWSEAERVPTTPRTSPEQVHAY